MSQIKITYKSGTDKKNFYVLQASTFTDFLFGIENHLKDVEINKLRKFWIDSDMDEIEIDNESSYRMFILHHDSMKQKRIFITESSIESKNNHIHFGVACDVCNCNPLIGFRYKCLECENFDLCSKCEGEMAHPDHPMIRLPTDIKNLIVSGKKEHGKRRHGHHHKRSRCPAFANILTNLEDLNYPSAKKASQSTEKQQSSSGEESPKPNHSASATKYEEHMNMSMNMLSNFHKMFTKILDPLGSEITIESHEKEDKQETKDEKKTEEIKKQNDKLDEASGCSYSIQEENWEVINKEKSSSPELVEKPEMRAVLVTNPSKQEMRAVLVTDCGSKMDAEDKADDDAKLTSEQPKSAETRTYHQNPKINEAIIAMMNMGFSNEGAWLTQLLESVNGDISLALDLMRPLK